MNPPVSPIASAGIVANGHDLLYLAATGTCLLVALHYLPRLVAPVGLLVRALAAAATVAVALGAALVLLLAVAAEGH